jgi:hypothetical protein
MALQNQRSLPNVVDSMIGNLQEIVRSEIRLAKTEIKDEAMKMGRAVALLGAGLFLGLYALGFLLLAGVYALATAVSPWLAALIVGVVVLALCGMFVMMGKKALQRVHGKPVKTIRTIKENVQWAKQQTK